MTRVSVVVPTWRTRELTLRCLAGVAAQLGADDELVVVDDAGGDGTAQAVRAIHPRATLVEHASNRGYTAAVRSGVERAAGRLLLLLNSDARLLPGALESLVPSSRIVRPTRPWRRASWTVKAARGTS